MDRIAFIYGEVTVYWSSIILMMAVATGVCFFWAFYLAKGNSPVSAAAAVPIAIVLSIILARFVHWYCRADSYDSLREAMTNFSTGGYALLGAFAGCFLTAALLRVLRIIPSLPGMLDSMSLAGCGAIALGRLACFYTSADRGQLLADFYGLPWAYPVLNPVSGAEEYRLATFVLQAMACGCIFVVLTVLYLQEKGNRELIPGDTTLLFLLFYGASQVILDSTRYDSLYLRSNGFISIVQILAAAALLLTVILFSVRTVKANGWKKWYLPVWIMLAAFFGGAGYMEYYVQRHGNQAAFAYRNMGGCLVGILILAMVLWVSAFRRERLLRLPTVYDIKEQ